MKHITAFLSTVLFAAAGVQAKPLKVLILAVALASANLQAQEPDYVFTREHRFDKVCLGPTGIMVS